MREGGTPTDDRQTWPLHVLRVFTDPDGRHGNPLGVFLTGRDIPEVERQRVARDLGFSETVFVDDPDRGVLRMFTPAAEIPLAGHPLVGSAWLLRREGHPIDALRPPAGEVPTWDDADLTWIESEPRWAPRFALRRLDSPAAVDAHPGAARDDELLQVWAWEDERRGHVRVRVFPRAFGIAEDEATGAAALLLGAQLGRALVIHQGVGSVIDVRPADGGSVRVGGRVVLQELRRYEPAR